MAAWRALMQEMDAMGSPVEQAFARVRTLSELTALSTEEMLARWLEARDPAYRMRDQLAQMRDTILAVVRARGDTATLDSLRVAGDTLFFGLVPDELVDRRSRTVIGTLLEDDSTAQVMYRVGEGFADPSVEQPGDAQVLTMRRTANGWRLWRGWFDWGGGAFFHAFGLVDEATQAAQLREAAERVVTWPPDDTTHAGATVPAVAPGRAYIVGYEGGITPARALVVETAPRDGAPPVRVEVPIAAFLELMTLMSPWPSAQEWADAQRRTPPPASTGRER